jgi:mannose-6-phosphate isomerase
MQHSAALEREARGFYTGAIGFLSPQRHGWWNVPIRTLQFVHGAPCARVDVGGGIVSDSRAAGEWNEILLKLRFLEPAYEGFEILETLRGGPDAGDIAAHVDRLARTAAAFGMEVDRERAFARIRLAAETREPQLIRVRAGRGGMRVTTEPLEPTPQPVTLTLSSQRVRSDDPLLRHKTAWRPAQDAATREARERGCFDAILLNERGEIAEGARTNIFARYGNTLYTPPLSSGVLPGILRSRLVSDGQAVERLLFERDLLAADAIYAGNSARGLMQARLLMNDTQLYPYVLQPKMAPAIWGGDALVEHFGKPGTPNEKIGESWECWDENLVLNGSLAGRSVADLRRELGAQLLGNLDPKQIFPILTKIIDARDSLSVQVHPDDAYAQRVEHQQNGKTECWYVIDAQPGAELVMGWTRNTNREEYQRRVADGSLGDILHRVPVQAGDAFYIPAGTLHAIGAGIIIFETQQASDLTYRIFDWNRVGPDGKPRQLHVQKAADVLDYQQSTIHGSVEELTYACEGFQRTALIADSHFIVERIQATETAATMGTHGRPLIIMALGGGLQLECPGGTARLLPYQTALVPAGAQHVSIRSTETATPFMCVTPPASPELMQKRLHDAGVAQPVIEQFLAQFRPLTPAA